MKVRVLLSILFLFFFRERLLPLSLNIIHMFVHFVAGRGGGLFDRQDLTNEFSPLLYTACWAKALKGVTNQGNFTRPNQTNNQMGSISTELI